MTHHSSTVENATVKLINLRMHLAAENFKVEPLKDACLTLQKYHFFKQSIFTVIFRKKWAISMLVTDVGDEMAR